MKCLCCQVPSYLRHSSRYATPQPSRVHPSSSIKKSGVPVIIKTVQWPAAKFNSTIKRNPHKSALKEWLFLGEGFVYMMHKGQWVLLASSLTRMLKGVRIIPVDVVPTRDRHPRTIMDYSFYDIN
jgi:hypothetical protein